jgi:ribonuclease inhibitor
MGRVRTIIQGLQVRTERDVHEQLARQLDFGSYYGWNLAALWDRLSTDVSRPIEIVWVDSADSRAALGDETFDALITVLEAAARQDVELGLAERLTLRIE